MAFFNLKLRPSLRKAFPAALLFAGLLLPLFFSCKTPSAPKVYSEADIPVEIMGDGKIKGDVLTGFLISENPLASREKVELLASIYMEECAFEGVNSDIAFAQMCLETGFLRFGGLVSEEMNNFCGLGAISPEEPGNSFPDERTGVRAHVQHLKGYGTAEPLRGSLEDPRYKWIIPKGKSPDIFGLSGTWAADPEYGHKIFAILSRMYGL